MVGRAIIEKIKPGSTADEIGLRPGDEVVFVNGRRMRDVIDFRFEVAGPRVELGVRGSDGNLVIYDIEKEYDDLLGIEFTEDVFDGLKTCRNKCPFCFVSNLPRGLRPSLYVRDDDYRLSFLYGNFITLTNLGPGDVERIVSQRLSPLYVSVHSTNPSIRQKMLGHPSGAEIMPILNSLSRSGIRFHFQIVICPGYNDGKDFESSLDDLLSLGEACLSVGVVPVGLTRFCHEPGLRPVSAAEAASILNRIEKWRRSQCCEVVYASDEFFIIAGHQIPEASYYGDYPQLENGIGMVRVFLDEARALSPPPKAVRSARRVVLVTSRSFEKYLACFAGRYSGVRGLSIETIAVDNEFFGPSVTVAGLITGQDLECALRKVLKGGVPDLVLIPETCQKQGVFLDGLKLEQITSGLGIRIEAIPVSPKAIDERIISG